MFAFPFSSPAFVLGFFPSLGVPELVVLAIIVLLLFGNRLPSVMRSLGQSITEFKKGTREGSQDVDAESKDH